MWMFKSGFCFMFLREVGAVFLSLQAPLTLFLSLCRSCLTLFHVLLVNLAWAHPFYSLCSAPLTSLSMFLVTAPFTALFQTHHPPHGTLSPGFLIGSLSTPHSECLPSLSSHPTHTSATGTLTAPFSVFQSVHWPIYHISGSDFDFLDLWPGSWSNNVYCQRWIPTDCTTDLILSSSFSKHFSFRFRIFVENRLKVALNPDVASWSAVILTTVLCSNQIHSTPE